MARSSFLLRKFYVVTMTGLTVLKTSVRNDQPLPPFCLYGETRCIKVFTYMIKPDGLIMIDPCIKPKIYNTFISRALGEI